MQEQEENKPQPGSAPPAEQKDEAAQPGPGSKTGEHVKFSTDPKLWQNPEHPGKYPGKYKDVNRSLAPPAGICPNCGTKTNGGICPTCAGKGGSNTL